MSRNNISELFNELHNSENEEEVVITIKKIIKGYNSSTYRDKIFDNVYFKTLIPEIKIDILKEIHSLKEDIEDKIVNIDTAMQEPDIKTNEFFKLKELKRECFRLLCDVNDKITDIVLLF